MWEWLFSYIPNLPSFAVGALSGLVTVLLKYYLDQKQRRREYTTNLLLNINAGRYLAPIAYRAFKLAESGVNFRNELSVDDLQKVEQTLDYLEFVAVCHRQKIVDTATLVRQEGMPILVLFRAAQPWIEDYRKRVGSNSIDHELERLVPIIERGHKRIYGKLAHSMEAAQPSPKISAETNTFPVAPT